MAVQVFNIGILNFSLTSKSAYRGITYDISFDHNFDSGLKFVLFDQIMLFDQNLHVLPQVGQKFAFIYFFGQNL